MQLSIIELYTLYYPNILIYLNILMLDEHFLHRNNSLVINSATVHVISVRI